MELLREQVLQLTDYMDFSANHKSHTHIFFYLLIYITYKEQIAISLLLCIYPRNSRWTRNSPVRRHSQYVSRHACCIGHVYRKIVMIMIIPLIYGKDAVIRYTLQGNLFQNWDDRRVCVHIYASIIKYKYKPEVIMNSTTLFEIPSMPILLVDSELQPRNRRAQKKQMQRVADFMNIFPESTNIIFDITDIKTEIAYNAFRELVDVYKDNELNTATRNDYGFERHNVMKKCIRTNQIALAILNVTHKRLNLIIDSIAEDYGMYGKYTDLGNGSFAYILCLLQTDGSNTCVALLSNELKMHDYNVMETYLARSGVKIEIMTDDDTCHNLDLNLTD